MPEVQDCHHDDDGHGRDKNGRVTANFGALKISPVFHWTDEQMEAYLAQHHLPNEWDYFDPAKADEKRECGLHAAWGKDAALTAAAL